MSAPSTERVQRLHTKRRLLGLCLRCAQPLSGTTAYCLGCRAKENAEHRARRLAYRTLSRDSCGRCRRPRVGLTALCETHYFQNRARLVLGSTSYASAIRQKLIDQDGLCYYTGVSLTLGDNDSLDHLFSVSKHPDLRAEIDNVVWCTREINTMKNGMDRDEFLAMCRLIGTRWPS